MRFSNEGGAQLSPKHRKCVVIYNPQAGKLRSGGPDRLERARRILSEETKYLRALLRPVDDLLGSADYKLYMTGVMLADALEQAGQNGNG